MITRTRIYQALLFGASAYSDEVRRILRERG